MQYDPKVTGEVIKQLRKDRRWTQEVLSGFADVARTNLTAIEHGKNAAVETLWNIAAAFDMPFSDMMRLVEKRIAEKEKSCDEK